METVMIDFLDDESLNTEETTWVGPSRNSPALPPVLLAAIAASRATPEAAPAAEDHHAR